MKDLPTTDLSSGALRVAFKHLEEAEDRITKAGRRMDMEITTENPQDNELSEAFCRIRSVRKEVMQELTNRDEDLR